jgi:hypothetical protein
MSRATVTLVASAESLPPVAGPILESLYQHRVLSTRQVHAMHTPRAGLRYCQRVLAELARAGLTGFVRAGRGGARLHHLTAAGAEAVELITTRPEPRRRLITSARAAGPLQQHTLAVNDTGIAFMHAARARGDECEPLAWRHEIAHPTGPARGTRGAPLVIADALLTYLQHEPDGGMAVHYAFVELDRATQPAADLAAKLARYTAVHAYTSKGASRPAWREHYPVFPLVLAILTGKPRATLQRRRDVVLDLCAASAELAIDGSVQVRIALLADLTKDGPFAPVFHTPADPDRAVDWLGTAGEGRR